MKIFFRMITVFILFLNCSEVTQVKTYTVEEKNGVKYVTNTAPLWNTEPKIVLYPDGILGELSDTDENFLFYQPSDIAGDADGNVYVLDSGNHRIQKFTQGDRYTGTIGGKGQGPGEFLKMTNLNIDGNGNLHVTDSRQVRIKILAPDGKEIKGITLGSVIKRLELMKSGSYAAISSGMYLPVQIYNDRGKVAKEFGNIEKVKSDDAYVYFNAVQLAVDSLDNIYVSFRTRNKIEKYSPDGKQVLSISRPLNYEVSREYKEVKRQFGGRSLSLPDINYVSVDITVDNRGRIWVLTYDRQLREEEETVGISIMSEEGPYVDKSLKLKDSKEVKTDAFCFHVFNSEGVFLCRIPLGHFGGKVRIFGDRLYVVDSQREMCVHKYRIEEK